jgi:hypothetical protein
MGLAGVYFQRLLVVADGALDVFGPITAGILSRAYGEFKL